MSTAPAALLGPDLAALVAGLGRPLLRVVALSQRGATPRPTAFRLELAGGLTLKASRLEHAGQTARVVALAALVGDGLARVVAHRDTALLCEWVEGDSLARQPADAALLEACGALLARAHRPAPAPFAGELRDLLPRRARGGERALTALHAAGHLTAGEGERLTARLRQLRPETCDGGVTLGDLCAENLVRRADGTPCLVDLETVAVDALGYDLARTFYRWPFAAAERAAFLAGYARHRDPRPLLVQQPFWSLIVLAYAAEYRARHRPAELAVPLRALRARAAGDGDGHGS